MLTAILLPASLLKKGKLQRRPLEHREGCDGDRPARLAGEAALQPHLLPVRVDLADVHWVKVPVGGGRGWKSRAVVSIYAQVAPSLRVSCKTTATWLAALHRLSWAKSICMHKQLFNISIASEGAAVQTPFSSLTYQTSSFKDGGPREAFSFLTFSRFFIVSSLPDLAVLHLTFVFLTIRIKREKEAASMLPFFYRGFWLLEINVYHP